MLTIASLIVAALALIAAVVVGILQTRRNYRLSDAIFFQNVFGVTFAVGKWFGNCFSPAVVLTYSRSILPYRPAVNAQKQLDAMGVITGMKAETLKRIIARPESYRLNFPAFATLVIRTGNHRETRVHFRLWGTNFNSDHLACWFGKQCEADFGYYYQWSVPAVLRPLLGQSHIKM